MKKLKKIELTLILVGGLLLSGCMVADNCPNNLQYYPFPYKHGETVIFENKNDSVQLFIAEIITEDDLGTTQRGDAGHYECAGSRSMTLSDFTYTIVQRVNWENNRISEYRYFENYFSYEDHDPEYGFIVLDTIEEYEYRNEIFKAYYYVKLSDSNDLETKYLNFTVSEDNRLLDFSKIEHGVIEEWFLQ